MKTKNKLKNTNVEKIEIKNEQVKQSSKELIDEMKIDNMDTKILKHLLADSRLSYRSISNSIGVSVGTVASRIKNLELNGVIKRYTTIIDDEKLGYQLSAIIELSVSKGKLVEVEEKIAGMSHVCGVYDITGTTDAMVIAKFRNRQELNDFVK